MADTVDKEVQAVVQDATKVEATIVADAKADVKVVQADIKTDVKTVEGDVKAVETKELSKFKTAWNKFIKKVLFALLFKK